jgi:N-acetylglucosamine-6-phosphate deacetylase
MKQIVNGRILTPQGWLENGSVLVEGNKIVNVINTALPIMCRNH